MGDDTTVIKTKPKMIKLSKTLKKKLKHFRANSRLLPDSAMTTYYSKPVFHAYGNSSISSLAPLGKGSYLQTFNVNPHSGKNRPEIV